MRDKIKAITFDLWDTVIIDDSDEPKRQAASRLSKSLERRLLVKQFIEKHTPVSQELVNTAYDAIDAAFNKTWHERYFTWSVRERLEMVLAGLGQKLPETEITELVRRHEEMELEFRPDLVPGIHHVLRKLHENYKLGVVSDTVFSPGRTLRKLLADEDLLHFFDIMIFSNEIGHSKPKPEAFYPVLNFFGIKPDELVHIGDRKNNDIIGPQMLGIRTILCTAIINRGVDSRLAEAVFSDYQELPQLLENINRLS